MDKEPQTPKNALQATDLSKSFPNFHPFSRIFPITSPFCGKLTINKALQFAERGLGLTLTEVGKLGLEVWGFKKINPQTWLDLSKSKVRG